MLVVDPHSMRLIPVNALEMTSTNEDRIRELEEENRRLRGG